MTAVTEPVVVSRITTNFHRSSSPPAPPYIVLIRVPTIVPVDAVNIGVTYKGPTPRWDSVPKYWTGSCSPKRSEQRQNENRDYQHHKQMESMGHTQKWQKWRNMKKSKMNKIKNQNMIFPVVFGSFSFVEPHWWYIYGHDELLWICYILINGSNSLTLTFSAIDSGQIGRGFVEWKDDHLRHST